MSTSNLFASYTLTALVVSTVLAVTGPISPAYADESAKKIQQIASSEDLDLNRSLCNEIHRSGPRKYAEYLCEGYEAIFRGQHDQALSSLEQTLEEQPEFALAAICYGDAYKILGDPDRAAAYYERAIDAQPRRTDSRFSLGALYLEEAKGGKEAYFAKALETFRQMAEVDPRSPDGFTNMGVVLTEMGRFDDAEMILKKAIQKSPGDPASHDNLALFYSRQDKADEAARSWQRALAANPGYGPATLELAALYGESGKLLEALQTLRAGELATAAPPWGPEIRRKLGYAFLGVDSVERAEYVFQNATTNGGDDALSHLALAHIRMTQANATAALALFRRGAALDPTAAAPFVLAWKAAVEFAMEGTEEGSLSELLAQLDEGGSQLATAQGVIGNKAGHGATKRLVEQVLPGWAFSDAAIVNEQLESLDESVSLHGYDQAPVPISRVTAEYPESAKRQGVEGEILVRVVVNKEGEVVEASAESESSDPRLVEAAIIAAEQWRFAPATRYGNKVDASITIPFRFSKRD